eukprot:jgi/Botrbrau1/17157/Bobra.0157s0051.1
MEIFFNLFVKEHNYLCKALRAYLPEKTSENDLFEHARHINIALSAKIHTVEWTPALLQNHLLNISMHSNWEGFASAIINVHLQPYLVSTSPLKRFYGEVGRIFANFVGILFQFLKIPSGAPEWRPERKRYFYGTPHSFSEEFVSVYRFHSLLLDVAVIGGKNVTLTNMTFSNVRPLLLDMKKRDDKSGIAGAIRSLGQSQMGSLTFGNYPKSLTQFRLPWQQEGDFINLGAIDVFRDRERNVTRYNDFRQNLGLPRIARFQDINNNSEVIKQLMDLYGGDINKVDALVGMLAEQKRPYNFAISETAFHVFIKMAARRLMCDRFFQESFTEQTYTPLGLNHIKVTTMKDIMIRHYPCLADDLKNITNVFATTWPGGKPTPKDITGFDLQMDFKPDAKTVRSYAARHSKRSANGGHVGQDVSSKLSIE